MMNAKLMNQSTVSRSYLISALKKTCLQKQEIAQLYKMMAKRESCQWRRELLQTMAVKSEQSMLRPARTLKRLGESVPSLHYSQMKQSWHRLIAQLNIPVALTWIKQLEERDTRRYRQILVEFLKQKPGIETNNPPVNPPVSNEITLKKMLSPCSRYRGESTPEHLNFNQALQEFTNQASIICALETSGKISSVEAVKRLDALWWQLEMSKLPILMAAEDNHQQKKP